MTKILGFETHDVRFPTSHKLDGSDAMNPSPDYSAAALILRTDGPDGLAGHAHAFTIGRGNDIQLAAIRAIEPFLAGLDVEETLADLGGLARRLVADSPLRWLGPETPGGSAELKPDSVREFSYPDGAAWREQLTTSGPLMSDGA
jgi:L-fuconate dehydratase